MSTNVDSLVYTNLQVKESTQGYIRLDRVTKKFATVIAVDQVNLSIREGEFFALLGPSGCGKTTTLRLIAGLEVPTAGRIWIDGADVTDMPPRNRDVAMVFQDYALYPHMTLLDNIGYPLKVRGIPRKQLIKRVTEVAQHLQIEHLLSRRPGEVSGGQQQRAAVARALVHEPKAFLFDEPLSNLDAKLRMEARAFLNHLQRELGVTTIYVTHDQAEALAMANRIAVMDKGKLIQVGTPLAVYHHPSTVFVASFIGNPPMNLLPCRLERTPNAMYLVGKGFRLHVPELLKKLSEEIQDGEELILGIRPEHVILSSSETLQAIPGKVYAIQPLGSEILITIQVEDMTMSARLFTDAVPSFTEEVWIVPDLERIHLYKKDGRLIL